MSISDEAVEVAARHLAFYTDRPGTDWTVEARALLEAAVPHMLAEFEKQRKYDALDAISELGSDDPNENPYRSQS